MKIEDKTLEYLWDQMTLAGIKPKLDKHAEWLRDAIIAYITLAKQEK